MSFSTAGSSQTSEINVTPLIDVLLVLLIIFMVIVPLTPTGLTALAPQPAPKSTAPPPEDPIILQVHSGMNGEAPSYTINQHPVAKADLVSRLTAIMAVRQQKVMFLKGDPGLSFNVMAEAISLSHRGSATDIGVLTSKAEKGE